MTNVVYTHFSKHRDAKEYLPHSSKETQDLILLMLKAEKLGEEEFEYAKEVVEDSDLFGDRSYIDVLARIDKSVYDLQNMLSEIWTGIRTSSEFACRRYLVKRTNQLMNIDHTQWSFIDSEVYHLIDTLLHNIDWYMKGMVNCRSIMPPG